MQAIFNAVDDREIGFPLFCFSVIVYNRWKQYSSAVQHKPRMDLDLFLAAMHDRMVPAYIRHTMDAVDSDIRLDYVIQAAQRIFADDKRAAGMGPNAHEGDDFRPTRERGDDFKIPGGYSDDHWRVYNKKVDDERRAQEEADQKAEEEARRKAEEDARIAEEERIKREEENRPVSDWVKHGGPAELSQHQNSSIPKDYSESEFVLN